MKQRWNSREGTEGKASRPAEGIGHGHVPGVPMLFCRSCQTLRGLQTSLIDLPLALAVVKVLGQQGKGSAQLPVAEPCLSLPLGHWARITGCADNCGRERWAMQEVGREEGVSAESCGEW